MSDQSPAVFSTTGTTAHRPDLNWSQIRETILMLGLAASQIRDSLIRGEDSVGTLTQAFTSLADQIARIRTALENLPLEGDTSSLCEDLLTRTGSASQDIQSAIVAFQFYDRLAQRLEHVCQSINGLAELIAEPQRLYNPSEWVWLQERIKSNYTMPEERMMFDLIMQGVSIEEALERSRLVSDESPDEDNLELF